MQQRYKKNRTIDRSDSTNVNEHLSSSNISVTKGAAWQIGQRLKYEE
jgi:hypothetical protein